MHSEPNDERVMALERRVSELDERLQTMETWSVETYQYQYLVRPNPTLAPPAPRWQPRPVPPPPVMQPPVAPIAPALHPALPPAAPPPPTRPLIVEPVQAYAPYMPQPMPSVNVSPGPPPGIPAPAPLMRPRPVTPRWSFSDYEQFFSGRGLAWIGGLAILLGAIFFLGLAFTRGWIGPAGRVGIGLVAGAALVAGGAWFFARREALFGHVLLAVGLGTTSVSLIAATRLYHLFPAGIGLIGALIVAVAAALVAIRANSQVVAAYGLVTALAAPPLLGASPTLTTIAFLTAALIGTTAIALYRTWNWLPGIAFLFTAPQLAGWLLDSAPLVVGVIALAGFWALNTLAAGGEEFRVRRDRLSPSSATLLAATALFLVSVGFGFLSQHDAADHGGYFLFLIVTACGYGAVGAYFLRANGTRHPFGLLATGTGIAALTMAIPVQFDGSVVAIAWAAEATALAWVFARRQHRFSGLASLVLGALSVAHLVLIEYPLFSSARHYRAVPFTGGAGMTLAFVLLAFAVASSFIRVRTLRASLTFVGFVLVAYALPFEMQGIPLLSGWAVLFVLTFATERIAPRLEARFPQFAALSGSADLGEWMRMTVAVIVGTLAIWQAYTDAIFNNLANRVVQNAFADGGARIISRPEVPFTDAKTLATGILIAAALLAAFFTRFAIVRRGAIIVAFAFAAILLPFELSDAATVVGWSALALGLCIVERRDRAGRTAYLSAAGTIAGLAAMVTFVQIAPISRLAVHAISPINHLFLLSGATAALGSLAVVLAIVGVWYRAYRPAQWLIAAAGAVTVYLLSVAIVDEFQRHAMNGTTVTTLVTLQKQAQVTLSIFWAMLGGAAFVIGLIRRHAAVRIGGLALLGIATVKVFFFDLASLDATYKVPSLIGLGILLLASSYIYQRLKPRDGDIRPSVGQ